MDDAWSHGAWSQFDQGQGYGEVEATGTGAAWVEVDDSIAGIDRGLVGVAADDHGDAGDFGVYIEIVDGMDEVENVALQLDCFGFGELGACALRVYVAADAGYGGNVAECVEDRWVADVSCVEDVVDTSEGREGFGAEEAVGVGDDAEKQWVS